MTAYLCDVLTLIALYCVLVAGLDIVAGRAGLVSVCHGALFGVGAYVAGVASLRDWPTIATLACVIALSIVCGAIVGSVAARVHAEYFLVVTFGFQVISSAIFVNWTAVTRGPMGIAGIPPLAGQAAVSGGALMASAIVAVFVLDGIGRSPYGRVLTAIRDDEVFARSLGKDVTSAKVRAFALSAVVAGLGGYLYAHWARYIAPSSFDLNKSILLVAMLVLGGAGTTVGVVAGAAILVTIPELARLLVGGPVAANLQGVLYGAVLVAVVTFRPVGLFGRSPGA